MTDTKNATGPVQIRAYVENSHRHVEMLTNDGAVVAHRWEHIVTGHHYVTEFTVEDNILGVDIVQHATKRQADVAWVKLYKKYN